jgi:hypothetical protein
MTEEQIDKMVDRFLSWPLPKDFCPDCGITFDRMVNKHVDGEIKECDRHNAGPGWWPVGTNLFTADQAREMVKHMLESTENENRSPSGMTD